MTRDWPTSIVMGRFQLNQNTEPMAGEEVLSFLDQVDYNILIGYYEMFALFSLSAFALNNLLNH